MPDMYISARQSGEPTRHLVVRAEGDSANLVAPIRATLREFAPGHPAPDVISLEDAVARAMAGARFRARVLMAFGVVAIVLAAIGAYSAISYIATERTREIGIRAALGATRPQVIGLVLRQSVGLALIGIGAGLVSAMVAARFVRGLLFKTSTLDPTTYVGAGLLTFGAALAASYIPARRALSIDPAIILRQE